MKTFFNRSKALLIILLGGFHIFTNYGMEKELIIPAIIITPAATVGFCLLYQKICSKYLKKPRTEHVSIYNPRHTTTIATSEHPNSLHNFESPDPLFDYDLLEKGMKSKTLATELDMTDMGILPFHIGKKTPPPCLDNECQ